MVVWLVGWDDRAVDTDGVEHTGRVESVTDAEAVFDGGRRIAIDGADAVKRGLGGAFANLAREPGYGALGTLLLLVSVLLQLYRWSILLRGADLPTPFSTVIRLGWIGLFFNQVLPAGQVGGDIVKAWLVARVHTDAKNAAVVSVLADRGMGLFALFTGAAAAMLFVPGDSRLALVRGVALGTFGFAAGFLLLLMVPRLRARIPLAAIFGRLPFGRTWVETGRSFARYTERPRVVAEAALIAFVVHAFFLASFYFLGRAVGAELNAMALFVAVPVAMMAGSLPGLPAGWGVGDMAFYFFLPAAGVDAGTAVALSFLFRALLMLISLPGGLLLRADAESRAEIARHQS